MRVWLYHLGPFTPVVVRSLHYPQTTFECRRITQLPVTVEPRVRALMLNPELFTGATERQRLRQLSQRIVCLGLLNQIHANRCLYWLEAGLHDCLTYPFRPHELRLKLERWTSLAFPASPDTWNDSETQTVEKQQLDRQVFLDHRAQLLVKDNVGIYLTAKEYQVLDSLYQRPNQLVSFAQIAQRLDPTAAEKEPSSNLISCYVSQLRKKAKHIRASLRIKSVYGYGYYVEATGRGVLFSAT